MPKTRIEKDSMGEMQVPEYAMYGASTARAVENFPVSDWRCLSIGATLVRAVILCQQSPI
mgnify:CR=1 FL=1